MFQATFEPFAETDATIDDGDLRLRFADDGYLFVRRLFDTSKVEAVRDEVVRQLKACCFVTADSTTVPAWTGRWPEGEELAPNGAVTAAVAKTGELGALSVAPELIRLLERLFETPVFAWKDADARMRAVLRNEESRHPSGEGPRFTFSTPAHQDHFFFRPVNFCTVWIPLMDINESVGGLALRKDSHREGLHQIWWQGKEFLGAAQSAAQADEWLRSSAVPVAGTTKPAAEDENKNWLRSDFKLGDAMIMDSLMMHAGVPNQSDIVRISADFRYQPAGTPTHWEAEANVAVREEYFDQVFRCLDQCGLEAGDYERVWEAMRMAGPTAGTSDDVASRVQRLTDEFRVQQK